VLFKREKKRERERERERERGRERERRFHGEILSVSPRDFFSLAAPR